MNNPLKYSNCWEDAYLLDAALQVNNHSEVMSIASAGDNSLYLLRNNPKKMVCIDMNKVQIFTTQLKEVAVRHLEYDEFLQFLGFVPSSVRRSLFDKLVDNLPTEARQYFMTNYQLIKGGIVYAGKFEQYFQLFSHKVLPWIHGKESVRRLFDQKSSDEQASYYNNKWNSLRWKLLFKLFFSRTVMGKLGREPEKMQYVDGSVGNYIYTKAAQHLASVRCQNNYIIEYALTGKYTHNIPPFAQKEDFNKIKGWLQDNKIIYETNLLNIAIQKHPGCDKFNLSNIFEYMDELTFQYNIDQVTAYSAKDATIAYWNLMVPRIIAHNQWNNIDVDQDDLGFFYQKFNLFKRCGQ